ncbi:MAG: glycosyltransferase [bacterium]|nr:glycosyltransferase [bacterium]
MKVALVHDYLREYGGGERVLEVLHSMYPEAPVYTAYYFADSMPESFKSWDIRTSLMQKWWGIKNKYLWYTYSVPWMLEQFDLRGYDLIISSSSFAAKGVLTHPGQVHVDYCHTPTRFVWGINRTSNRKFIHALLGPVDTFLRQWDFAAAQRVDYFIANSKTVQERITRFYKRDSIVIYPPVELPNSSAESAAGSCYLMIGRLERLKNVDVIIRAFNRLGLPLRIAGTGSEELSLKAIANKNIEFCGYVSDAYRKDLYRNCLALVVAAENEDFGMTLPEVQSFGRPVIALRSGGYVESIVEDKTGIFFDKLGEEQVIEAVERFQKSVFDPAIIREHARIFSKDEFVLKFSRFIETVV